MALEEKYSKKYDCKSVELVDEGNGKETYKILVTKNNGELKDFIEVTVPATVDTAVEEMGAGEVVNMVQKRLVTEARNRKRSRMVSEEEREQQRERELSRVEKLIESLKQDGLSQEEIMEQLNA